MLWPRVSFPFCSAVRFLLIGLCLAFALPATRLPQESPPPGLKDALIRIEELTAREVAKEDIGSLTIGIVSGPDLVWTRSFGYADMEDKRPATRDSVYRIGSISKQFTALMLLQLADEGKVHLADPVEKYLKEVNRIADRREWAPPITLIQLATMTSGIDREPAHLTDHLVGKVADWDKVLVGALTDARYANEPGTQYLYSNIGYAILGASLSRAAGQPFVDYVKERIFLPLGMTHTAFEADADLERNLAAGYAVGRDGTVDAGTPAREHAGRGYKVPNGAIYTTIGDLARFVSFELGEGPETVLKRKSWEDNLGRVQTADGALTFGYGVGFQVRRRGNFVYYGHGGSVAGYNASALFEPVSKTGAIVLRSAGGRLNVGALCAQALEIAVNARASSGQ